MDENEIKSFLKSGALGGATAATPEASLEDTMRTAQKALDEAKTAAAKEQAAKTAESAPPEDTVQYTYTGIDHPLIRKAIESRLPQLDLDELLFRGYVTQVVPIIPGKLIVQYRSLNDTDTSWCETTALRESMELHGGLQRVAAVRSSRLALAMSVMDINQQAMPRLTMADKSPTARKDIFERAELLTNSYSAPMINAMTVNMVWFNSRVIKLLNDAIFLGHG